MPALPQELLDVIVGEVDDVAALKALSLTGSQVRDTSQRILLRSFSLTTGRWPNYAATKRFLEDSPHIAGYITRLAIEIPQQHTDIETLQQVLNRLVNVRRCILDGVSDIFHWDELPPAFASDLLDFLQRQPLRELHVTVIKRLPVSALCRLVMAAPILSFFFVYLNLGDVLPYAAAPYASAREHLILESESEDICTVMARPESIVGVASLRRLSIPPHYVHAEPLIHAAASALQHLRLYCQTLVGALALSLPSLPLLNIIKFGLAFRDRAVPWFLATLIRILAPTSSPLLTDIIVTFFPVIEPYNLRPYLLGTELMTALDNALAAHPATPRIRWRLDFRGDAVAHDFDVFAEAVRRGMPKVQGAGRLALEAYVQPSGYVDGIPYEI
ncbi:hypothetical protein FB451DRAFT_1266144 [Mycena latifolia]|nr:hypothetical protein FB451DRAFT_1266144 [Mycena latifolia]